MAGNQKPRADQAEEQAPKFTKAELLDAAEAFGVTREFLAGALYGVEEATREEAESLAEKYKTKGAN